MWKFTIKQDGVICALGRMKTKEDCLRECFRYLNQFAEEDFDLFTMEIFKVEE